MCVLQYRKTYASLAPPFTESLASLAPSFTEPAASLTADLASLYASLALSPRSCKHHRHGLKSGLEIPSNDRTKPMAMVDDLDCGTQYFKGRVKRVDTGIFEDIPQREQQSCGGRPQVLKEHGSS